MAKKMIIFIFSAFTPQKTNFPILFGKLKWKRLPKKTALNNPHMVLGQYEPHVIKGILSTNGPITVAYDIGAHIGFLTLALAKLVGKGGRVFCFEPIPENYHLLQELIASNHLQQVVQVIPVAIGNAVGQERMLMIGPSTMMPRLEQTLNGTNITNYPEITVKTLTFDAFVFDQSNPAPNLIKIDVEGAEALVLQGGLRTLKVYSPKLVIEIHGPNSAQRMWSLLQRFDYSWIRLRANGQEEVSSKEELLSFFSKDSWTHHFLLTQQ